MTISCLLLVHYCAIDLVLSVGICLFVSLLASNFTVCFCLACVTASEGGRRSGAEGKFDLKVSPAVSQQGKDCIF